MASKREIRVHTIAVGVEDGWLRIFGVCLGEVYEYDAFVRGWFKLPMDLVDRPGRALPSDFTAQEASE